MTVRQNDIATSARFPLLLAVLAVGGSAVLAYGLPAGAPSREFLAAAVLLAAPAAALAACIVAALAVSRTHSIPWQILCSAAALALIGQLHRYAAPGLNVDALHTASNAAAAALYAAAVAFLLRQKTTGRTLEIALDVGILGTASLLVLGRWTSIEEQLVGQLGAELGSGAVAVATAAGAAAIAAAVLILARSATTGRPASSLGAATVPLTVSGLAIAVWLLAVIFDGRAPASPCCGLSALGSGAFVVAWLGLAWGCVQSLRAKPTLTRPIETIAAGSRVRLLAAPMAALLLGTMALDAAVNDTFGVSLATGMGVLGILLALRLGHLLHTTRSHSADHLQLSQSLALIEVSRALSGMRHIDETLTLVTRWAVRLLDGRAAVIELLRPDNETLEVHAVYGLPDEMIGLSFPLEGSFTGWVVRNGRARCTENARLDPLLNAASLPYLSGSPLASVPLRYSDKTLGTLSCISNQPFTAADLDLLGAFADQAAVAIENARLFRQVHQLSITDPLTGLANRRQLERDIAREFSAARRGRRLIAVMFDLNRFKAFNDRYGHLAGDDALRRFGVAIRTITRSMNVAARFGGDEFIVLLTDADPDGARVFIERVQATFPGPDAAEHLRELSVCGGFAECTPDMTHPEQLIAAADAALYLNKAPSVRR